MSTNPMAAASAWTDRTSIPHFIRGILKADEKSGRYVGTTDDFAWCRTGEGATEEGDLGATRLLIWSEGLISGQRPGWVRVTRAPFLASDGSMLHGGEWATLFEQGSQIRIRPVTEGLDTRGVGYSESHGTSSFDAGSAPCFVCEPDGSLNVYNAARPQSMSPIASRAASKLMAQGYGMGLWLEGMGWVPNGGESSSQIHPHGVPRMFTAEEQAAALEAKHQ
ncbi:uncharacterized protein MKK02DRAFT_40383 [Dioszegia hungarica]|uniref:Uncharacterized protein n=1 Tax=Dioszegia hungarica TaxID=4972 RepID=A0AA38H2M7_9TREE|nr:uncharacterized protein MKK02DRAFT_40383 [Dioszegia hungarica]KAI9633003.1 hypothetical protein MKK02DRAFT_40383 [Dioszegia hungarica]